MRNLRDNPCSYLADEDWDYLVDDLIYRRKYRTLDEFFQDVEYWDRVAYEEQKESLSQ